MSVVRKQTLVFAATLVACVVSSSAVGAHRAVIARRLSLELVGQVINTPVGVTPATSAQFGYVSYLLGLPIFKTEPEDESTALFTFFIEANTVRVINDGPLRIVTRLGTMTIYHDPSAGGTFDTPDSFREGTPVLVAQFRQQVVIDTISSTFSTHNLDQVTTTNPFPAGKRSLQLGVVGSKFETVLNGHLNMPGPPSAYFAGYTFSTQ